MIARNVGANQMYALGEVCKNVFFMKFKMAEKLSKRRLVVPMAIL